MAGLVFFVISISKKFSDILSLFKNRCITSQPNNKVLLIISSHLISSHLISSHLISSHCFAKFISCTFQSQKLYCQILQNRLSYRHDDLQNQGYYSISNGLY